MTPSRQSPGRQTSKPTLASFAPLKIAGKKNESELGIKRTDAVFEHIVADARGFERPQPVRAVALSGEFHVDSTPCICVCAACPAYELNLCAAVMKKAQSVADVHPGASPLTSSAHTVPARRAISHPKEWSEFVTIICDGWAVSSLTLQDGRRQILSFLLSGDLVSTASLLEPMSGRAVEAVTEVTYRKFKRSDLKAFLFKHPDLMAKLSKVWIKEQAYSDQLALDLGRRTGNERIAKLILNLAERLAERGMMNGQTMELPFRQRHIADATGLTAVHVSRVLREFQRAGLIEISSRSLTIINVTELRHVAGPAVATFTSSGRTDQNA